MAIEEEGVWVAPFLTSVGVVVVPLIALPICAAAVFGSGVVAVAGVAGVFGSGVFGSGVVAVAGVAGAFGSGVVVAAGAGVDVNGVAAAFAAGGSGGGAGGADATSGGAFGSGAVAVAGVDGAFGSIPFPFSPAAL